MISKIDLEKVARLKSLTIKNCERDYLIDLILFNIYKTIKNELVFKGGTCLYKIHSLNRFSEDLDFTLTSKSFDAQKIFSRIVNNIQLTGVDIKLKLINEYKNEINLGLECKGPLFDGSKESLVFIPINISKREKIMLPKQELIISSYYEIPSYDVYSLSLKEIMAEKIRALMTRNKPRDLYDLWFLFKKNIDLDMKLVQSKLDIYKIKFSITTLIERIDSLKYMWETDLRNIIIGNLPEFKEVNNEVIAKLQNLSK